MTNWKTISSLLVGTVCALAVPLYAQTGTQASSTNQTVQSQSSTNASSSSSVLSTNVPLDIKADSLEYERDKGLLIASGHVTVKQLYEVLRGDHVVINMNTYDVYAEGHVTFERYSEMWMGEKLRYNFKTRKGDFGTFMAYLDPFYIQAPSCKQISATEYELKNAKITTCEGENPFAYMKATTVKLIPGHHVYAWNVVLYVGGVPIMYAPYWSQNVGDPNFITMVPGYNSRMWVFLLTTFNYRVSRHVEAATHVDYRLRRGIAVGQDVMWSSSGNAKGLTTQRFTPQSDDAPWYFGQKPGLSATEMETDEDNWYGDLMTYYAQDQWPTEDKSYSYTVDNERYRMRLYHDHTIDEHNYFSSQINYLSDPLIIKHFFRDEYRANPEPDNYLVLGNRGDKYVLSLLMEKRLNDYFTAIDRFPELSLNFTRMKLGESPLYYQGKNAASFLNKQFEQTDTNSQNYAVFRFNTEHMIYYPTKQFGFLNVIPRAGYQGTYYSKTKEDYVVTNAYIVTNTTVVGTVTNITTTNSAVTNVSMNALGSEYRSVYQLGMETSMKAFKIWETYPGAMLRGVRHIVEPYSDYKYVPEPNLVPDNIYQYDTVDTVTQDHSIKLGVRNKLQTKRDVIYNLVNLDIWSTYRIERTPNTNRFSSIFFTEQTSPFDWLNFNWDGEFDQYDGNFKQLNTRVAFQDVGYWEFNVEHRYSDQSNNLLSDNLSFSPFINWKYSIYSRYQFDDSTLEEWGCSVQRTMDCLTTHVGFEQSDDSFGFWIQFWFTQFPKVKVDVGM